MKFWTFVFFGPALAAAVPVAEAQNGVALPNHAVRALQSAYSKREPEGILVERAYTCNAKSPAENTREYQNYKKKIKEAKKAAEAADEGVRKCKSKDFNSSTDKKIKQEIKDKCVAGYKQCASERAKANKACRDAGGAANDDKDQVLQTCENQEKEWENK